jgi:DNA polymerase III delta subunit
MAKSASQAESGTPVEAPIVVFVGPERFLALDHTDKLRAALHKKHGDVQVALFDGGSASAADVLDELRSLSLMMTHKLVIVDNAESMLKEPEEDDAAVPPLPPGKRRPAARGPRELFTAYAEAPEPSATLVLRAGKWNKGNLDKAIAKTSGVFVECDELGSAEAAAWCVRRAPSQHKVKIDPATAKLLVDNIGPDMGRLDSELAKLAVAVLGMGGGAAGAAGDPVITPRLVGTLVGYSREEEIWHIQRFLLQPDPAVALREVRRLLEVSRESPVGLLVSYLDLARKLDGVTRGLAARENPAAITGRLRMWGPSVNAIFETARRLRPSQTAELLGAVVDADSRSKSSRGDAEHMVEGLTLRFVSMGR